MGENEYKDLLRAIHDIALQVAIVKQKQEDNHTDNKNDIRILYDKVLKFDSLPCQSHVEKLKNYEAHIAEGQAYRKVILGLVSTFILSVAGVAVAWGALQERVMQHEEYSKKVWEHCCAEKIKKDL